MPEWFIEYERDGTVLALNSDGEFLCQDPPLPVRLSAQFIAVTPVSNAQR